MVEHRSGRRPTHNWIAKPRGPPSGGMATASESRPIRREPSLEGTLELLECRVQAVLNGCQPGDLAEYPRRTLPAASRRCPLHSRPHRPLRIGWLGATRLPKASGAQPATEVTEIVSPAQNSGSLYQVSPDPRFELGLDDDSLCSILPAVSRQVGVHVALNPLARVTASASVTVEQYKTVPVTTQEGPQEVRCTRSTPTVPVRVPSDFKPKRSEFQIISSRKQCLDYFFEILVRNEHDQVHGVADFTHPITPVAKSVSMSTDPCQSRRMDGRCRE